MGCVCSKPQDEPQGQAQISSKSKRQQETKMSSKFTTILYGGGPFYTSDQQQFDSIKQSGYTTIMCWALHINDNAEIWFNNEHIVKQGNDTFKYDGDPNWPTRLASLKEGDTQVNRVMFSIGGWGVQDFQNIQTLIFPDGTGKPPNTGPNSTIYKAFDALKVAIPCIDGFDLDDESLYDHHTTVAFCRMLASMGYQVTFCPYINQPFWNGCLKALNTQPDGSGPVTGYNLQCYAGGTGNQPEDWIQSIQDTMGSTFNATGFVFPGLSCRTNAGGQCPSSITQTFQGWQSTCISGGFIWLYDYILENENSGLCSEGQSMTAAAYTAAIVSGLS